MALAHDTTTRFPVSATATVVETTTGDRTISHAGSASAKGVAVTLYVASGTADGVTGITYGGVALTKRQTASDTTEANRVTVWTLPDNTLCPTGTQNVVFQGCAATAKVGYISTVTASATNSTAYNAGNAVNTTTSSNPTVSVTTTQTSLLYGGVGGGAAAPTSYAAGTNYTLNDTTGADFGALSSRGQRRTSPVASGTITFDFAYGTSDDWCIAAVALAEYDVPPTTSGEYETSLTNPAVGPPDVDTDHSVTIRAWATAGSGIILARLMQGTTEIDSWSETLTGSAANYIHPVTSGDAATITDYNDLRIELKAEGLTGLTVRVSQAFMTFPEGSFTSGEVTGAVSWVGSVTGTTLRSGAVTGAVGWVGTVNGSALQQGSVSGAIGWVGTVDGEAPAIGVNDGDVTGAITWAGTVTGTTLRTGDVSGAVSWVGSVTGSTLYSGAVSGDTQSVRFDEGSEYYSRSASGLGGSSLTMACWVYLSVDTNFYAGFLAAWGSSTNYIAIETDDDGTTLDFYALFASAAGGVTGPSVNMSVGQWYYTAFSFDTAGTGVMYYATAADSALTPVSLGFSSYSGVTEPSTFYIGMDGWDSDRLNGRIAQVKVWKAALTQAELEVEKPLDSVALTANLWGYYSFRNGPQTNDESGNARTLTVSGTPTSEIGPLTINEIEWVGAVTGLRQSIGAVSGAIDWVGTVTGTTVHSGAVSGAVSWIGSVTGSTLHSGAVSGANTWVGSVAGTTYKNGSVSGSIGWVGSVVGETPLDLFGGSIDGVVTWTGTVTGLRPSLGSVTGAIEWTGSVTGARLGTVNGVVTWGIGIVHGERVSSGAIEGAITWIGAVQGPNAFVILEIGFIADVITGPGIAKRTINGPLTRRAIDGPILQREIVGPSILVEAVAGPNNVTETINGPSTVRTITGPDTSRTTTGPET